jgi:hypothetical protein
MSVLVVILLHYFVRALIAGSGSAAPPQRAAWPSSQRGGEGPGLSTVLTARAVSTAAAG